MTILLNTIFNDHPQPWQLGFQDGATTTFYGIVDLHDSIMFYLIIILIGVTWVQTSVMLDSYGNSDKLIYKYNNHDELEMGQFRLLEVDNRIVVPVDTRVRIVATAADVIHSFAVPSLGVKVDCIPGRINQTSFLIDREGVFYGQCSELCGTAHGFMPIVVEAVSLDKYISWVDSQLNG
uniref:cytochrome-c oxidase n=1 Tax=Romanomermis culicivorax TaxID=13658 RepID=A0A915KQZ6_ROMCU